MKKYGKKYRGVLGEARAKDFFNLEEAVAVLKKTATTKFDSSCEVHFNLGVDTKHADQIVRATMVLPHGTGKDVRVVAFVDEDKVKEAKDAGASEAGVEELVEKVQKGWLDFDVAVATPDQMKKIGKIAKILGQRGLMPNPKAGTVTTDIAATIGEIKKGKIEFRTDKLGNIHNVFGKASFDEAKLLENAKALIKAVSDAKPSGVKGTYIKSITFATTMGPGVKLDVSEVLAAL